MRTSRIAGVRNDRMRRLIAAAVRQGCTWALDGRGHVRVTNPETGRWFVVSTTSAGSAIGHTYENTRAQARRAGVDVRGL